MSFRIPDEKLIELASLFLETKDVKDNDWTECCFVFEFGEGHVSNSGYLYDGDEVTPAIASIECYPVLLGYKLLELRELIYSECGHKFIQLLFQMENKTKRFKIDFEFDDPKRWAITPCNMFEMRERLKPVFDKE
ncbi:hypothetical protein ABT56_15355 [Photobacterium aquae]|uniref:Uncharacterized protein n=1 Tax=Photobacterium aquae TaxID=1195763 RepID=A0A0J1GWL6_9GAMM|nr:hypothetical protein [Photobacterium aquae]KLV04006.1 hypothetical protein ABT56_15355 [Photobacterium aquae]